MAYEGDAFGYQSNRSVATLNSMGKRLSSAEIPKGQICLSFSKETGFVSITSPRVSWEGGSRGSEAPYLNVFTSQSTLCYQSLGVTFIGDSKKGYLDALFGRYSGLALNQSNTKLAFVSDDPSNLGLYVFDLKDDVSKLSLKGIKPVLPHITSIGSCLVQPLRNDLVFIDEKRLLFTAEVFPEVGKPEFETWKSSIPLVLEVPEKSSRRLAEVFIVVTDIRNGETLVIGKVATYKSLEPGSPRHGTLTTSKDGTSSYLLFGRSVLCIKRQKRGE